MSRDRPATSAREARRVDLGSLRDLVHEVPAAHEIDVDHAGTRFVAARRPPPAALDHDGYWCGVARP
ncbi:hypothetical protein I6A60_18305 [Frankia sp. AgB1.9]|uniref:hypothetical protein n=1 Tax=Frankia sp. AgB1.9 TaxID=1836968 RepID=UPI001933CAB7|nr:hypothetical protein [Frankia sp. AgB1.9]MBL7493554.1 hypothetical protein [Frankia sp. AgW1.1]MBL7549815.1 hypothetical protein [Frankia sp. AgB1.9]